MTEPWSGFGAFDPIVTRSATPTIGYAGGKLTFKCETEGSTISDGNQAVINTNLTPGSIAVVKIGEKAIKVLIK